MSSCKNITFREVEGAKVTDNLVKAYRGTKKEFPVNKEMSEEEIVNQSIQIEPNTGQVLVQEDAMQVHLHDGQRTKKYFIDVVSKKGAWIHFAHSFWKLSIDITYARSKTGERCDVGNRSMSIYYDRGWTHPTTYIKAIKVGNFDGDAKNKTDIAIELLDGSLVFYLQN